jgi:hypothetical membrane protein
MEQLPAAARRALLLAGPVLFAAMIVAGLGWREPAYSWIQNNISDLGNVTAGMWDDSRPRVVDSPLHAVFNIGAIVTGLLLVVGVLGLKPVAGRTVRGLALLGAFGFIAVGAFPADINESAHWVAALLVFFAGNAAMLLHGLRPPVLLPRWQSLALGASGLLGAILFVREIDLGLGLGLIERVAVFPFLAWTFLLGIKARERVAAARALSLRHG